MSEFIVLSAAEKKQHRSRIQNLNQSAFAWFRTFTSYRNIVGVNEFETFLANEKISPCKLFDGSIESFDNFKRLLSSDKVNELKDSKGRWFTIGKYIADTEADLDAKEVLDFIGSITETEVNPETKEETSVTYNKYRKPVAKLTYAHMVKILRVLTSVYVAEISQN